MNEKELNMNDDVHLLKGIGLTMYEAQAYVALTSLISATADEVSEKSGIPRSKIYAVLKKLNEKNFLEIEDGRPLLYTAKSPVEVLTREKEKLTQEIDDSITRLTNIYENGISQVQAPIWRIYGVEKIINKETEIIKRAKNTVNMRIGFLFENEAELLLKEFKKRKNLDIKILASPACYINGEKFETIEFFRANDIEIYEADIPFAKVMISDSKEMFHTYTKFSQDKRNIIPETAIGIWNQYEDVARNYDERFENQWRKIKKNTFRL